MKKVVAVVGLAAVISSPVMAGVSANVTVVSDYLFRGLTQTDNQPAVQGGIDLETESGFYLGTWASNTDFNGPGATASGAEIDFYLGFAGEASGISYDVGFISYQYPKLSDSLEEIYLGVGYGVFSAKYSYDSDNDYSYIEAAVDLEVGNEVGLGFHVGSASVDGPGDYTDVSVSLSKTVKDWDWGLGLSNTDLDGDDVTAFVSVGTSFDL